MLLDLDGNAVWEVQLLAQDVVCFHDLDELTLERSAHEHPVQLSCTTAACLFTRTPGWVAIGCGFTQARGAQHRVRSCDDPVTDSELELELQSAPLFEQHRSLLRTEASGQIAVGSIYHLQD
jgi:hypothetical protein